jgi:hypothetical protein
VTLYSEIFDRLFSGLVAAKYWAVALFAYVMLDLALLTDGIEAVPAIALFLMAICLVIAVMTIQWKVTRLLGEAPANQRGSISEWIGWSLLSLLIYAVIPIAIVVAIWGVDFLDSQLTSAALIVVMAVAASFVSPMLVHATGRALDANGPSFGQTVVGCRPFYFQLVIASALISTSLWGGSEVLALYVKPGEIDFLNIMLTIAAAFLHFAAFALLTSLATLAWLKATREGQKQT